MKGLFEFLKKNWKVVLLFVAVLLALVLLCSFGLFDSHGAVVGLAAAIPITGGGVAVSGEPVSADIAKEESPELLRDFIDKEVCKIRPSSTPLDTISRSSKPVMIDSREYSFYSVATKPQLSTLKDQYTEAAAVGAKLNTDNNDNFEPGDTILVPEVAGYDVDETTEKDNLVLYVMSKDEDGKLNVLAVNGKKIGSTHGVVPTISAGAKLLRMGRAGAEKDAQTAQFETVPTKETNYAQIFQAQVEVTDVYKEWTAKEVDYNFTDMEEDAIYDMKRGMETSFLFSKKSKFRDTKKKEEVWTTEGIWWQAGKDFQYTKGSLTKEDLISLCKTALTGVAGSKEKLLFAGSDLIEEINKLDFYKVLQGEQFKAELGMTFDSIHSKFGDLYVIYCESFDMAGMPECGLVIDDTYMTKAVLRSLSKQELDLKKAGIRSTNGEFITEISCLVLKNPDAHVRITVSD